MPENPEPILRPNGVPYVRNQGPARPLAPSQSLTTLQAKRVEQIVLKLVEPLTMRIKELEEALSQKPKATEKPEKAKPAKPDPEKPKVDPVKPAAVLPTATAEISEDAQKLIDQALNPDLKRALIAIAKKDVPEEVKLKQMSAALARYQTP